MGRDIALPRFGGQARGWPQRKVSWSYITGGGRTDSNENLAHTGGPVKRGPIGMRVDDLRMPCHRLHVSRDVHPQSAVAKPKSASNLTIDSPSRLTNC
jgi:hypothetical protein